jgi:hypothetical protein
MFVVADLQVVERFPAVPFRRHEKLADLALIEDSHSFTGSFGVNMIVGSCIPFGSRARIWCCSKSASFTRKRKPLPYNS